MLDIKVDVYIIYLKKYSVDLNDYIELTTLRRQNNVNDLRIIIIFFM